MEKEEILMLRHIC